MKFQLSFSVGLALLVGPVVSWPATAERTNFVLVNLDDLAMSQFRPEFFPLLFDRFQSDTGWIKLNRFYATSSVCCPSRASILVGRYAEGDGDGTGVFFNSPQEDRPGHGGNLAFYTNGWEDESIAVLLDDVGYNTALIGKYMNGYGSFERDGVPPGQDPTIPAPPGWDYWKAFVHPGAQYYNYTLSIQGVEKHFGDRPPDYSTRRLGRSALKAIERAARQDEPFFIYLNLFTPHGTNDNNLSAIPDPRHVGEFASLAPYRPLNYDDIGTNPPFWLQTRNWGPHQVDQFDNAYRGGGESLLSADETIEAIFQQLARSQAQHNTLVWIFSDNGYSFGEHRFSRKRCYMDQGNRVPSVVRVPSLTNRIPREESALTMNIDIMPTLLGFAGYSDEAIESLNMDGSNLASFFLTNQPLSRSEILIEDWSNDLGNNCVPPGSGRSCSVPDYKGIITEEGLKYVRFNGGTFETVLYDMTIDPFELNNIVSTVDPEVIQDLENRLDALLGN